MPKYYCDYCDTFLTHDSPSVRKTHCNGRKHKENVRFFYQKWMEEQAQTLIDVTTAAFKANKTMVPPAMALRPPGAPPGIMPPGALPPGIRFPPGAPPPPIPLPPGARLPIGLPPVAGLPPGAAPPLIQIPGAPGMIPPGALRPPPPPLGSTVGAAPPPPPPMMATGGQASQMNRAALKPQ